MDKDDQKNNFSSQKNVLKEEDERNDLEKLKEELARCGREKDENLAGWQRQKADFLNYQKEVSGQIERISKFANEDLIYNLLPVLDSFNLSLKSFENKELSGDEKNMLKGVEMIKSQLENILKQKGLEEINCLGREFDPEIHEAVSSRLGEASKKGADEEKLIVIEEMQKGYKLSGKIIRPAKVVAGGKSEEK